MAAAPQAICPWSFLALEESQSPSHTAPSQRKTFAQALNNACDFPYSQLPRPRLKGETVSIKIPEEEYKAGLESCKNHLRGRLILSKGEQPIKVNELRAKLSALWKPLNQWAMISLGKGFYEFSFASAEDLRGVWAIGQWNLNPGILRLSSWTPDFNPYNQKQSSAQCWVRIFGLPQEYWRPKIIFAIAGGLGIPISLDEATSKKTFGHFARVLVDIDLKAKLHSHVIVEREEHDFVVNIEYEKLPAFCTFCQNIGHSIANCKRMNGSNAGIHSERPPVRNSRKIYVPKNTDQNTIVINSQHQTLVNNGVAATLDPEGVPNLVALANNADSVSAEFLDHQPAAQGIVNPVATANNVESVSADFPDLQPEFEGIAGTDVNPLAGFVAAPDINLIQQPVVAVEFISEQQLIQNGVLDSPIGAVNSVSASMVGTVVEDSLQSSDNRNISVIRNFASAALQNSVLQTPIAIDNQISNQNVAQDLRIVGRLWSDQMEEEEDGVNPPNIDPVHDDSRAVKYLADNQNFTVVLSKSQKKKLKKKANQNVKKDHLKARHRAGPHNFA